MKKIVILLSVFALVFSSCKKYDISNPVNVNSFPKVSISGVVKASFEEGKVDAPIPAGTELVFTISNASYMTGATGSHVVTVITGQNGEYTVEIPVPSNGLNAVVSSSDFISEYIVTDNISYNKVYKLAPKTVALRQDVNVIENLTFVGTAIDDTGNENRIEPTSTSKLSGTLEYLSRIDENDNSIYSYIPNGTKIEVKITLTEFEDEDPIAGKYIETQTITVGNSGKYTIDVPMIPDGKAKVEINSATILEFTEYNSENQAVKKDYRYKLEQSVLVYEKDVNEKDFKYTQGVMVN